jgi:hypothetical protein
VLASIAMCHTLINDLVRVCSIQHCYRSIQTAASCAFQHDCEYQQALSAASPGIAIGLLMWERSHLLEAFESRSAAEPGILSLTFRLKMTQMSLGFYGQSTNGAVKVRDVLCLRLEPTIDAANAKSFVLSTCASTTMQGLLANPNSKGLQSAVKIILSAEINNRQIEFATLVTRNKTILLSPNSANGL